MLPNNQKRGQETSSFFAYFLLALVIAGVIGYAVWKLSQKGEVVLKLTPEVKDLIKLKCQYTSEFFDNWCEPTNEVSQDGKIHYVSCHYLYTLSGSKLPPDVTVSSKCNNVGTEKDEAAKNFCEKELIFKVDKGKKTYYVNGVECTIIVDSTGKKSVLFNSEVLQTKESPIESKKEESPSNSEEVDKTTPLKNLEVGKYYKIKDSSIIVKVNRKEGDKFIVEVYDVNKKDIKTNLCEQEKKIEEVSSCPFYG
ncbi:MAG: hypothetical protein QW273_02245 [Candidatus Pacearchaeota archaeon]